MTPRPRKDETKAGRWSKQVGEYGRVVRIRERERGKRVQLIYRDPATDRRMYAYSKTVATIRDPFGKPDPRLIDRVIAEAKELIQRIDTERLAESLEPARVTFAAGFARFHDVHKGGLPQSKSARVHHAAARRFWLLAVDGSTPWNRIVPGEIEAAATRLARSGKVPSAEKFVRCLRTVFHWLRKHGLEGLKDPTRELDLKRLRAGHEPARPRYRTDELARLVAVAPEVDPRFHFALIWADDSGARSAALYRAMRSQVDEQLEVEPTTEQAPCGWVLFGAMKAQDRQLVFLTERQRRVFDDAIGERWTGVRTARGFLSALEARWKAGELQDYPLLPGGDLPRSGVFLHAESGVSNMTLDGWLREAEKRADVPHVKRRGWHGIRRAWADYTAARADIDTVMAAGAWADREMPERVYVQRRRHDRLARSREIQEGKR